jgi:superfamily I DNA and RNA helicase
MLKFTLLNEKVCIDPNIKMIDEFNDILLHGKKVKDDNLAFRMLLYVFYCCDLSDDNLMRDVDYRLKPEQAMVRAFQGKKKKFTKVEEALIEAAMDAYNFFNETSAERAVLAIDKKIDEARTVLEETDVEIVRNTNASTGAISFVSNESILNNLAKSIGDLMTLKISISNAAKKLETSGRVRGNKGSSLIERGNLVRKSEDIVATDE